jgi:hypothetical protein
MMPEDLVGFSCPLNPTESLSYLSVHNDADAAFISISDVLEVAT